MPNTLSSRAEVAERQRLEGSAVEGSPEAGEFRFPVTLLQEGIPPLAPECGPDIIATKRSVGMTGFSGGREFLIPHSSFLIFLRFLRVHPRQPGLDGEVE